MSRHSTPGTPDVTTLRIGCKYRDNSGYFSLMRSSSQVLWVTFFLLAIEARVRFMSAPRRRQFINTPRGRLEETAFGMLADLEALDWPAGLDKETSAKLYEACAAEWKADMQSGFVRNVREASEPVEAESLPASRSLQSISSSLTAEEARWRSSGVALQQHWLQEAQSMFVRWRAEDSARLTAALRQAASATVSFEARLAALPPAPRPGWAALCAALRVEAAGPGAVLEAARHEFGATAAASLAVVEGEQAVAPRAAGAARRGCGRGSTRRRR